MPHERGYRGPRKPPPIALPLLPPILEANCFRCGMTATHGKRRRTRLGTVVTEFYCFVCYEAGLR